MKYFLIFAVVMTLLILTVFILLLYWALRIPTCGGDLDPNLRWCKNGKLVSGKPIPADCNPTSALASTNAMASFFGYVTRLSHQASEQPSLSASLQSLGTTRLGFLLFAVPELLQLLPSDFGQNYTTPYGMISFYDSFLPCIESPAEFCEYISKNQDATFQELCLGYFAYKKKTAVFPCPFGVTDHSASPPVWIEDPNFFNALGLLGAFSLQPTQAVVFYTDLPVADLGLNYWSYVVYLADSLDINSQCSPRQQVSFSSLSSPLNMFTSVGVANKKFNPLTAETGTVTKGHVKFYTVLALDPQLGPVHQVTLGNVAPVPRRFYSRVSDSVGARFHQNRFPPREPQPPADRGSHVPSRIPATRLFFTTEPLPLLLHRVHRSKSSRFYPRPRKLFPPIRGGLTSSTDSVHPVSYLYPFAGLHVLSPPNIDQSSRE